MQTFDPSLLAADAADKGHQASNTRVLAIIPSAFCFGLQNITLSIFQELFPNTPSHFIITRWNDGEFPRRLRQLKIPFSETWLGMFSRKLDWHNIKMTLECLVKLPSAYVVFWRVYRRFRPTCILVANHHEAVLLLPVLLWVRKKVVCHMHDPPPNVAFQRATFRGWRSAVNRFVFVSDNAKLRLALLGPSGAKDVVIYNGVAVSELVMPLRRDGSFCAQFGWPSDSLIVGLTGQMTPIKGHEDFIAAAAIVAEVNPRARFVIGGKKNEPHFSRLKDLIATARLENVVQFSGWLETSAQFFRAIDLFVLASRHEEGFGLVLAEAGERGLASVATRSGGATEIVVDGDTGILVEKVMPDQMAQAIEELLADDSRREQMGLRARARVSEYFNLSRQAEKLREFLAKI